VTVTVRTVTVTVSVRVVMRVILGRVLVLCLEVWFVCIMSSVSVVIEV